MTIVISPIRIGLVASVALALLSIGCVGRELRDMDAEREAYDACVFERSADHPACQASKRRLLEAQRRYEENSRRAWSCDPQTEECPTKR